MLVICVQWLCCDSKWVGDQSFPPSSSKFFYKKLKKYFFASNFFQNWFRMIQTQVATFFNVWAQKLLTFYSRECFVKLLSLINSLSYKYQIGRKWSIIWRSFIWHRLINLFENQRQYIEKLLMKIWVSIVNTVETRYNGLEGTGEFWLLNLNVVKSNHQFLVFFYKYI